LVNDLICPTTIGRRPFQHPLLNLWAVLGRDEIRMNRHRAPDSCLRMIFSENRFRLFRIMR
jgi:hypothetical protein